MNTNIALFKNVFGRECCGNTWCVVLSGFSALAVAASTYLEDLLLTQHQMNMNEAGHCK